jgi:hypothetical protein
MPFINEMGAHLRRHAEIAPEVSICIIKVDAKQSRCFRLEEIVVSQI